MHLLVGSQPPGWALTTSGGPQSRGEPPPHMDGKNEAQGGTAHKAPRGPALLPRAGCPCDPKGQTSSHP